jgi:hypothetical protein
MSSEAEDDLILAGGLALVIVIMFALGFIAGQLL